MKEKTINTLRKFILTGVCCLMASCASIPNQTPSPWDFPRRGYEVTSQAEQEHLVTSLQPCIERARGTLPQALKRFARGLPDETDFRVILFDDQKYTSQLSVWFVDGDQIEGRLSNLYRIDGKPYAPGEVIKVDLADVVDWYIIHRDRPAEGNLIGRYLLLKQDGLAPGACDPDDIEFQQYRFFAADYSFIPPGTDGWEMREPPEGQDLLMLQRGEGPSELNTLSSGLYRFPPVHSQQELVERAWAFTQHRPEDPGRYELLEHEIEPYQKPQTAPVTINSLALCAISRQKIRDNEAMLADTGERGILVRESRSLVCKHPSESAAAVVVNYSHRYQPGHRNPEFFDAADSVFASIAFKTRN